MGDSASFGFVNAAIQSVCEYKADHAEALEPIQWQESKPNGFVKNADGSWSYVPAPSYRRIPQNST